jgi:hypothetical protein
MRAKKTKKQKIFLVHLLIASRIIIFSKLKKNIEYEIFFC